MKAVVLLESGASPQPVDDAPEPSPGPGEVLVRIQASSANPVDNAIAAGMLSGMVEHEFPVTLGRDYAGVVEALGDGVSRWQEGDAVYGFLRHAEPTIHRGTWAELVVVPEDRSIARRPGVDVTTAGAAPLAGITALAAIDALALAPGRSVLVIGANGGVGSIAVQLAVDAGASVLAPGLPEDADLLRDLGVTAVLDREGDVAAQVREHHPDGVDALVDLASYDADSFNAFAAALKPGGRAASPLGAAGDGPGRANVGAEPTAENLDRLAKLLDDGLGVPIQATYELADAPAALQALREEHTQGKRAIRVG
jgi:NADPH:quinone reductase-like Zn-dependent oxidoreductase